MINDRLVMIPGPTPIARSIQEQMGREVQAFGDPRFVSDYKSLISDLKELFFCDGIAFPLAGTGTLAMEMAISNSAKRGDNVLIVSHGFFGDRFIEICERKGLNYDVLSSEWGDIVPLDKISEALSQKKYAAITVSHVDTSTGVRAPIEEIGELLKKHPGVLYIVDGVAATAGEYTDMAAANMDVLFTGSQKAFGCSPGMFILWANNRALERRKSLGTIPEYFVDYEKWLPIMEDPTKYFATPAVNQIWALQESVRIMKEEGMKARFERHKLHAAALQEAFIALGFSILAKKEYRAVTLSNLVYPDGLDDASFRNAMMEEGVVIAGGLKEYAGKMCRIGHMGNAGAPEFVVMLGALERALNKCGAAVPYGTGVGAYLSLLS